MRVKKFLIWIYGFGIWANDFPKRQKFNLKEMCALFMLDKSQQTFNDPNHVQNSFVVWVGKNKEAKEAEDNTGKSNSKNPKYEPL